ncbi:MAG: TonB-dependent receptor [Deltaproteobacteria bacterium]|nr:TonB-dependent receptor [Deltaproteobacteria bacterium]
MRQPTGRVHKREIASGLLLLAAMLLSARQACADAAATSDTPASDESLRELVSLLEDQTEIATRTKLNVDYVPGSVSVVSGDELLTRGARTVFEALPLVPGVQTSILPTGIQQVIIRGLGKVFRSGKVKLMLNGVAVNSTFTGEGNMLFAIPIEQVDRIEVIRGPGSAVYGEYALAGVVNVVTRTTGNEIYTRVDENGGVTPGGLFSYQFPDHDAGLSINVAGVRSDGADVTSGPDGLYGTPNEAVSLAPGPTNEAESLVSALVDLHYRKTSLGVQYVNDEKGTAFGLSSAYGPTHGTPRAEGHLAVDARQQWHPLESLDVDFNLGWSRYTLNTDPRGSPQTPPGFKSAQFEYPDGQNLGVDYPEHRYHGGAQATYRGFDRHRLLAGIDLAYIEEEDASTSQNYDPQTLEPLPEIAKFPGELGLVDAGLTRRIVGTFVQDEFSLFEPLTLTAGARYDDYDDAGGNFSPRFALVYRPLEAHIFKFQYGEAFRPPTFAESSAHTINTQGNPDLDPETVRTFELGYIYNSGPTLGRVTFSVSDVDDLITKDATRKYVNSGSAELKGVEIELAHTVGKRLELEGNFSYVDAENSSTNTPVPDVAEILANAGAIFRPLPTLTLAVQYRYTGSMHRAAGDGRDDLDDVHAVDLIARAFDVGYRGFTLSGGVRNLFDADVVVPAAAGTWRGDLPRPGREFWGEVAYKW